MGEKKSYFDEQDEGSVDDACHCHGRRGSDETTTSRTGATAPVGADADRVLPVRRHGGYTCTLAPVVVRVGQRRAVQLHARGAGMGAFGGAALRKFNRVAGPGLIFMIPLVEYSAATVDMRTLDGLQGRARADGRPRSRERGRRAVLDGGCREGVLGGEELRPSGVLGGANHRAT
ncbi:MAG: hypothetical protein ACLTMP_08800 [Eggerthella lenta]